MHRGKEECAEALKYAKTEKDILAAQYVIELIRAVLEDRKPQEKPHQIDWNDIFRMTQKHNLQCMIYDGVVRTAGLPEQTIMEKWTKSVRLCSMQSIMQQEESVYIFGKLKQREIRVLPLKGYFMKELYPKEVKSILEAVEDECDKMEYEGSLMFDEYPDRLMLERVTNRIYDRIKNDGEESVMAEEFWGGRNPPPPPPPGMEPGRPPGHRPPPPPPPQNDPMCSLIGVILNNEMYRRRCRHRRCRRWW